MFNWQDEIFLQKNTLEKWRSDDKNFIPFAKYNKSPYYRTEAPKPITNPEIKAKKGNFKR